MRLVLALAVALAIPCATATARADEFRPLRAPYLGPEFTLDASGNVMGPGPPLVLAGLSLRVGVQVGDSVVVRATSPRLVVGSMVLSDRRETGAGWDYAPSLGLFVNASPDNDVTITGGVEVLSNLRGRFYLEGVDPLFMAFGVAHTFVTRLVGSASRRHDARTTYATLVIVPSFAAGNVPNLETADARDDALRVDLGVAWRSGAQLEASLGALSSRVPFDDDVYRSWMTAASLQAGMTWKRFTGYVGAYLLLERDQYLQNNEYVGGVLGVRFDAWPR